MIKNMYIQYSEFRAHCFSGQATSCSKVLKDKKYFNTEKFQGNSVFQSKNLNDKKSVTGRQGREFLP